ncbi:unnamed protein product, partial [Meganyctiphanes norvegica]
MSDKIVRILVVGDVEGNFNQLFKRIHTVQKKNGPFSMLLCIGEFFGPNNSEWLPYKNGQLKVPLLTYILGPHKTELKFNYPDLKGCELCENVIYLGPAGIYPCSNGLRIAYLSGYEDEGSKDGIHFDFDCVRGLETEAGKKAQVDILLSTQWPMNVCTYAKTPEDVNPDEESSSLISRLAFKLRPRYHLSAGKGIFYERLPYRNHKVLVEATKPVTRFISLAKVGNDAKQKWLYAFSMTPASHSSPAELVKQPEDVTECPYKENELPKESEKANKNSGGAQFFYDMNTKQDDHQGKRRRDDSSGGERKKGPKQPAGPCWFCLASPEVEKHLVVSIGSHAYLALAKGGLNAYHLLILPITHFQATPDLEEEGRKEIEQFKSALKKMFKGAGKTVVFFERNYRSQHLQVQIVPLPEDTAPYIKEQFMDLAESYGIELEDIPKLSDIAQVAHPGVPFFYVELPNGEKLYHRIKKSFPLQFGR